MEEQAPPCRIVYNRGRPASKGAIVFEDLGHPELFTIERAGACVAHDCVGGRGGQHRRVGDVLQDERGVWEACCP